jgi:hypothetical protein
MKLSLTYHPLVSSTLTNTAQSLARNSLSTSIGMVDAAMFGHSSAPRSFTVTGDEDGDAIVALAPYAELALLEIESIATTTAHSVPAKRKAIKHTLALAGFPVARFGVPVRSQAQSEFTSNRASTCF